MVYTNSKLSGLALLLALGCKGKDKDDTDVLPTTYVTPGDTDTDTDADVDADTDADTDTDTVYVTGDTGTTTVDPFDGWASLPDGSGLRPGCYGIEGPSTFDALYAPNGAHKILTYVGNGCLEGTILKSEGNISNVQGTPSMVSIGCGLDANDSDYFNVVVAENVPGSNLSGLTFDRELEFYVVGEQPGTSDPLVLRLVCDGALPGETDTGVTPYVDFQTSCTAELTKPYN